ncbi:MAG: hypothetical protein KKC30_16725 [Proteobacteria bacterium]|nr:hypothetical protein [Pseudomonadota bacterium]MBU4278388.1 hypothetical protein [Pseudomonadota bacterium]MBU4382024.1 hypothetical protein [Pseudomonadota bacterium]MBU4604820.1 hypothetical protein [Pseudomonadota bacterium]MCG2762900.1 hypothetical protein [Desulfarculaceae bacterium]
MASGGLWSGCLVLRLSPPQPSWPPAPPPPTQDAATLGLYLILVLLLLLFVLLGLAARRAWRQAGEGMPLDQEDQALLRTARDALVFVIKRRMRRARLVLVGKR